jgi:excisionase family DNA binding protein
LPGRTARPELLTPSTVAKWLNLPIRRVIRLAKRGDIPCIKLPGGDLAFDRRELAAWIAKHRHPGPRLARGEAGRA